MNTFVLTKNTQSYRDALSATESIEPSAFGFVRPSDITATEGIRTLIKQNNIQIQLLVQISEKLQEIQTEFATVRKAPSSSSSVPDSLIEKLQNLSISKRPKEGSGVLRVFKDTYQILKEEKEKLKK